MICCTPKTCYGVLSQWFLIHSFSTLFITLLTISLVCPTLFNFLTLQMPTPKMVKRIQTIHRLLLTNCLSLFDHFVGLALKGFSYFSSFMQLLSVFLAAVICLTHEDTVKLCKCFFYSYMQEEMQQTLRFSCMNFVTSIFAELVFNTHLLDLGNYKTKKIDFIFNIDAASQPNAVFSRPNTDCLKNICLKIVALSSSRKKVFLKVLQNVQENSCSGVSFLVKLLA